MGYRLEFKSGPENAPENATENATVNATENATENAHENAYESILIVLWFDRILLITSPIRYDR